MIKISVHIENNELDCDPDVSYLIELPQVPQKGDVLKLGKEIFEKLELQARKSVDVAQKYAPDWFFFKSFGEDCITNKDLKNLTFIDACFVSGVFYTPNLDIVAIEMSAEMHD